MSDLEEQAGKVANGAHESAGWGYAAETLLSASIAISLKRIADMIAEDRRPEIAVVPEGYVSVEEHREIARSLAERSTAAVERIADFLAASADRSAERHDPQGHGPQDESAVPDRADAPKGAA
jgi:Flp pilus assembly CpaF family ATPase